MPLKITFLILLTTVLQPILHAKESNIHRPNKDHALFFANDDYSGNQNFTNLRNPVRDARAIAEELQTMYGFTATVYHNKTKQEIYRILQQWQNKRFGNDDQLFVFFSGHGTFNEFEKTGYFVPKGSGSDYGEYIDLTKLGNIVTEINCPHILLTIDACYSGTIDQEIAFKGFGDRPGAQQGQRNALIQRQLRNKSRLLITSGGKERTPDGRAHSPFAGAILKGLKGAYSYGDGLFLFPDLISQLERVNPRPHQGELMGHNAGGFVFIVNDGASRSATVVVDRDGNTYGFKTMKDGKVWMTNNLNLALEESFCYQDQDANCQKYGRLYTWEAAKEACAALGVGWRLPTDEEWKKLAESYGGYYDWESSKDVGQPKNAYNSLFGAGSNAFATQLGGYRYSDGSYNYEGRLGYFWSSTARGDDDAWTYTFNSNDGKLYRSDFRKALARSVRCLQD